MFNDSLSIWGKYRTILRGGEIVDYVVRGTPIQKISYKRIEYNVSCDKQSI